MNASEHSFPGRPAEDFTRTWRYKLGLGLIIIGNVGLVIGLLLPLLGLAPGGHAGLVGVLIIGGEVVSLSSIVFLGKEGFKAIKSKVFAFVKAGYAAPVGPVRHYIGIALLCTNILTVYATMLYAWTAFDATTAESPMPAVWGFDFAQQGSLVLWLFLTGEFCFLISIYVLGADWWGRFRNIFVWKEAEA
jgi:hypothetical protein